VIYVLYALKLKLWLRSNPVLKSFLLRKWAIDPGIKLKLNGRRNADLQKNQGRNMIILWLHYEADATRVVPELY